MTDVSACQSVRTQKEKAGRRWIRTLPSACLSRYFAGSRRFHLVYTVGTHDFFQHATKWPGFLSSNGGSSWLHWGVA